tara:strand:- start:44 stop:448 length:405 start_codon:yes stop_codon:yes gene_type:complete
MKNIIKLLRNILQNNIKEKLFVDGIALFNEKKFYDAHEIWEELWSEYRLKDHLFIQGLIQLSVAFFHITNLNLKGSSNLFKKCLPKLKKFPINHRNINVSEIIICAENSEKKVNSIKKVDEFDWKLVPKIIQSI